VTLSGVVTDSVSDSTLAGAVVELLSEARPADARSVRADSLGRYTFSGVLPGRYLIDFLHPALDAYGIEPPVQRFVVEPGGPARLDLSTPAPARILAAVCGERAGRDSSGALAGTIRDADSGAPLGAGKVVLTWSELAFSARGLAAETRRVPAVATALGTFMICGVPSDVEVVASGELGRRTSGLVELRVPARGILRRDFLVGDSTSVRTVAADTAGGPALLAGSARLTGVVRTPAGEPVSGATVLVLGAASRARTATDGSFALTNLPAGTHTLEARAIGYAPKRVAVDLASRATRSASLRLDERATTLSRVLVQGRRADTRNARDLDGFLQRRQRGFGSFVSAEDIERRNPFYVSDALRTIPSVRLVPTRFGRSIPTIRGNCTPAIVLDGTPVLGGADVLDDLVRPQDIAGIEVYSSPGTVPAQYAQPGGSSGCAILLWTKR
jgi:hypothetical protein